MHELGVLTQVVRTVRRVADQNHIEKIKHITLDIGKDSTFVPIFLKKLYPVTIDQIELLKGSELKINMVQGTGLQIKDIGY
ncbi:MAG: hydrogenase maturation nickel metallochaperone HypA [Lachnospiraceae bacterium]|nr:hydrogenase maturation nickel metallochaperone HypA [Lachnospiraceae bacterium]